MSGKPATATGDGGEGPTTGNSDGGTTMAAQKKRLRRVSFAEMTSVHFFDRDEDNETPVEEAAARVSEDGNGANEREERSGLLGFRELLDSRGEDEGEGRENGDGDSEDEELAIMRRPFLRPAESPSPGSTFGSATSNDEDNFFGPVSASFIRPGCLSDSAVSNDKHDVTMDSTAFSMHFRSLARSDSGVGLKTPTGIRLSFEEKTPTQTNAESSMELTVPKKPIPQFSSPAGSSGSSDMSLVGEKSNKYDYGRMSPRLDALLAEGSKNLKATSASDFSVASKSLQDSESCILPLEKHVSGLMDVNQNRKAASSLDNRSGEANGCFSSSPVSHSTSGLLSNMSKPLAPDVLTDYSNSSLSLLSKMRSSPSCQDKLKLGHEDKYIQHESPLVELVSFSPEKGRIFKINTSPTQHMPMSTPRELGCSHICNENVKHHKSASSVQKSISKLKLLEASPFSSYLMAKIENSTTRALDFSRDSPFSNSLDIVTNNSKVQHLDESVRGMKVQHSRVPQEKLLCASINDNQIEDPVDGGHMIHRGGSMTPDTSPSESSLPQERKHDLFRSRSPRKKELVTGGTGTDYSLAEIALDHAGERKTANTPKQIVPSPDKEVERKRISPKLQGQQSNDLLLHDKLMRLRKIFPSQESATKGEITDPSTTTVSLDELNSFSLGRKGHASSFLVGLSNSNLVDLNHNQKGSFEMMEILRTPTEAKESHFICQTKLDCGPQTGIELPSFEGKCPGVESKSVLPSADTSLKEFTLQRDLMDCFARSHSRNEAERSPVNKSASSSEDNLSPSSNKLSSHSRKRSSDVAKIEETNYSNGPAAIRSSAKLQKVENHDPRTLRCPNGDGADTSMTIINLKHWKDKYSRFLKDSENFLSPPIDKLNLSVIALLENILFNLQRSKTYRFLHSQIFTQKTSVTDDFHHQRVNQARLLLHQIIHEKAKSQLMCVKQQKLQDKVQLLSSGIWESQTLKLEVVLACRGHVQVDATALQNLVNTRNRGEVDHEKIIAMNHTLETLDKRNTNLIRSLTTACKIKGEPSCMDSISLVTNHLKKKSFCRLLCLDMQTWKIDDVKRKNGSREIVLNYLDFVTLSMKVFVPTASCVTISYKLEDVKIMKNFPNMDACAAFSFVFNAETTRKYSGLRSLAQEIQVTSSFLGNLVDVVQEVQLAWMELRHLTQTTFHCPLAGQLHLQLDFFSFGSGQKVTLTLDLSGLKRGIYPSEILPSQLKVVYGLQSLPAAPVLDEITDTLKSLRAGHARILRLCRCVAQVIQLSREL